MSAGCAVAPTWNWAVAPDIMVVARTIDIVLTLSWMVLVTWGASP
jgi:hypothetical protein